MTDQENLKLQLLELYAGDIDKAKAALAWVSDVIDPPAPEVVQVAQGVVLTDAEVLNNDDAGLKLVAMARLAVKQNANIALEQVAP